MTSGASAGVAVCWLGVVNLRSVDRLRETSGVGVTAVTGWFRAKDLRRVDRRRGASEDGSCEDVVGLLVVGDFRTAFRRFRGVVGVVGELAFLLVPRGLS